MISQSLDKAAAQEPLVAWKPGRVLIVLELPDRVLSQTRGSKR